MNAVPLTLHLPHSQLEAEGRLPFYQRLIDGFTARGGQVQLALHDRATAQASIEATPGFHILDHGRLRHPRALNAGVAYVYPFWHLDPWGIRAFSSIAAQVFDPASIPPGPARAFADRLRTRLILGRKSRYAQPPECIALPQGSIAVFLQDESHRDLTETCHLDMDQMLTALTARDDPRPILIKPHPLDSDATRHRILRRLARHDPRVQVVTANIHDMIAAADAVVTINSATGLEAMMQGKPVILCGRADFHHNATTVTTAAELDAALSAPPQKRDDDAYLYWYFRQMCLSAQSQTLIDDVLTRIAAQGFDPAAFALTPE
jgi:DNA-binding transcriptional ArsR family regulator